MSIGARSQSAKTYLEKHYESFADCTYSSGVLHLRPPEVDGGIILSSGSLEDLVRHGLHALRETLQQDKELNINNTSIGIVGPKSENETKEVSGGAFRILENSSIVPFLKTMVAKESADAPPTAAPAPAAADEDVQMSE